MAVHIVQKDDGSFWEVLYQGGTIVWNALSARPDGFTPGGGEPTPAPRPPHMPGPTPFHLALQVADVGAALWQTWELRQQRKFIETSQEQAQRIEWLTEMMGRWGSVHRGGGGLDLRSSEYLVREVNALVDVLVSNKKLLLPQTLLYDLDLIRDSFRSMRLLLAEQFRALFANEEIQIKRVVQDALPGYSLNIDFIEQLTEEPIIEPPAATRSRSSSSSEKSLLESIRSEEDFQKTLFPSIALEVHTPVEELDEGPGAPARLMKKIADTLSDRLLWPRAEDTKGDLGDRAHDFRELVLLAAEFRRVRALNDAWLAVSVIATEKLDEPLRVIVAPEGVAVERGTSDQWTSSLTASLGNRGQQRELQSRAADESDTHQ